MLGKTSLCTFKPVINIARPDYVDKKCVRGSYKLRSVGT